MPARLCPGLLQTSEYARAVCEMWLPLLHPETVNQRVGSRLARQMIFERRPLPAISFVIEEHVLRRPLGGLEVMRGQLEEVLLRAQQRNVVVQVMPIGCVEHAALDGPFTGRPRQTGPETLRHDGGYGIPLGRFLAGANRHDSPLLAPTLGRLAGLGPLPDEITVHLDAGYHSDTTRTLLDERGLRGRIAHKGEKAPVRASRRWHVERTHAWQNAFHRLARCYERRVSVIDAFFDLADTAITVCSLIRRAWTTHRWDTHPQRRR